ncbi:MAG TPA: hypothetical protein VFF49_04790 [Thermodesulfobacteriota bacterium]|nr:hypothetical protein [Thermodesulfobacteriota bacterium]
MLLEGKELEGKIGEKGSYSVDVDTTGLIEIKLGGGDLMADGFEGGAYVKLTLMSILEKVAAKTETQWDDAAVMSIKKILGLVA